MKAKKKRFEAAMRFGGDSLGQALQQLRNDAAVNGLTIIASSSQADSCCAVRAPKPAPDGLVSNRREKENRSMELLLAMENACLGAFHCVSHPCYASSCNICSIFHAQIAFLVGTALSILDSMKETYVYICVPFLLRLQLRIVRTLLQLDGTRYSVKAVSGNDELVYKLSELAHSLHTNDMRECVLLINCGGSDDVLSFVSEASGLDFSSLVERVYICDSTRPIAHGNAKRENDKVAVLLLHQAEDVDGRDAAFAAAFGIGKQRAYQLEDDNKENVSPPHLREGEDDDPEVLEDEADPRHRTAASPASTSGAQGQWYGPSAAVVMYEIAYAAHMDSLAGCSPLWCACVGIADQLLHRRISAAEHTRRAETLAARCGAPGSNERVEPVRHEKSLFTLRHWSLYDALVHSDWLAPQLFTWCDRGREGVLTLLAKMGLSVKEAQKPYLHMGPASKSTLEDRLADAVEELSGSHTRFAFERPQAGAGTARVSSTDAALALTALLARDGATSKAQQQEAFIDACAALDETGTSRLRHGIELAKAAQQAALEHLGSVYTAPSGSALIARRYFRVVDLEQISGPGDSPSNSHPLHLLRLAQLFQDAVRNGALGARKQRKPLLLFAPPQMMATDVFSTYEDASSEVSDEWVRAVAVNAAPEPKDTDRHGAIFASIVKDAALRLEGDGAADDFLDACGILIRKTNKERLRRLVHSQMGSSPSLAAAVQADET